MDLGLKDKVAWVVGASSGLGLASARSLAREGATIAISARRSDELRKHASVCHGVKAWARDDGDGVRDVHCTGCAGAGTGPRAFLRTFRGVHKYYLADYVATYETMANAKRITPTVIRRMGCGDRLHTQTHEPPKRIMSSVA